MQPKLYIKLLLILITTVIVFHLCIVAKIIPYHIAWGGRLQSDAEMYVFEALSITLNLLLVGALVLKGRFINYTINPKIVNSILWIFFVLFLLNTIGNLFAKTVFEKTFSIATLVFALLLWKILRTGHNNNNVVN